MRNRRSVVRWKLGTLALASTKLKPFFDRGVAPDPLKELTALPYSESSKKATPSSFPTPSTPTVSRPRRFGPLQLPDHGCASVSSMHEYWWHSQPLVLWCSWCIRWEQNELSLRGSVIIRPNIIALSSLFCFSLLTKWILDCKFWVYDSVWPSDKFWHATHRAIRCINSTAECNACDIEWGYNVYNTTNTGTGPVDLSSHLFARLARP